MLSIPLRFLRAFFISAIFLIPASAQQKASGNGLKLSYHWEVDHTGAVPDPVFTLSNAGTKTLAARGWKIYFNSVKKPFIKMGGKGYFDLQPINGDLFSIQAGKEFKSLEAGASYSIHLTVPEIRNATELPIGFYIVFDDAPTKGISITNATKADNSIEAAIAEVSYHKNEKILQLKAQDIPPIFPSPVSFKHGEGNYVFDAKSRIYTSTLFKNEAALLADDLKVLLGTAPVIGSGQALGGIQLIEGNAPEGGYLLSVDQTGIKITASTTAGMFYGIQSLKSSFPISSWAAKQKSIAVPAIKVTDSPRFLHRALMLDVARNFQPKEEILRVLDLMALYKLNVLHFHLNDDEGWRLEIPGLPELTAVGSKRGHTLTSEHTLPPSYGSGPDTSNNFGTGFYSRKDFIDILIYARKRHIAVIPEIESPGHARAAIKSMDARYRYYSAKGQTAEATQYLLSDMGDSSVYRSVQGWHDNVINVALPSAYAFVQKVTDEIAGMYAAADAPLKTIHMGGDEVPDGVWEKSPAVKKLMSEDQSIGTVYDLWKYYFTKVNAILNAKNLYLSGWEEIGLKKVAKRKWVVDSTVADRNYHTDVWNNIIGTGNEDLAYRLANAGFKVAASNVTNMYLDMAYNNSFMEHGMNWAGFVDVDKPFFFIPNNYYLNTTEDEYGRTVSKNVFAGKAPLKTDSRNNIFGLQSALWSETINKKGLLEYLLLPKLLGLAERAWAKDPQWVDADAGVINESAYQQAYATFIGSLGFRELPRLDHFNGGFAYRIPEPGVEVSDGKIKANIMFPGLTIRYTTDGTEPTKRSAAYTGAIATKGTVSLKVFNPEGRSGKKVVITLR